MRDVDKQHNHLCELHRTVPVLDSVFDKSFNELH